MKKGHYVNYNIPMNTGTGRLIPSHKRRPAGHACQCPAKRKCTTPYLATTVSHLTNLKASSTLYTPHNTPHQAFRTTFSVKTQIRDCTRCQDQRTGHRCAPILSIGAWTSYSVEARDRRREKHALGKKNAKNDYLMSNTGQTGSQMEKRMNTCDLPHRIQPPLNCRCPSI